MSGSKAAKKLNLAGYIQKYHILDITWILEITWDDTQNTWHDARTEITASSFHKNTHIENQTRARAHTHTNMYIRRNKTFRPFSIIFQSRYLGNVGHKYECVYCVRILLKIVSSTILHLLFANFGDVCVCVVVHHGESERTNELKTASEQRERESVREQEWKQKQQMWMSESIIITL